MKVGPPLGRALASGRALSQVFHGVARRCMGPLVPLAYHSGCLPLAGTIIFIIICLFSIYLYCIFITTILCSPRSPSFYTSPIAAARSFA